MLHPAFRAAALTCVAVCALMTSPASAALVIADFSGSVQFPTPVGNIFYGMNGNTAIYKAVSGSVVYDTAMVPGSGSLSIALGSTADGAFNFKAGTIFNIDRGDLATGGVAMIRFKNGNFNGLDFTSDFSDAGKDYRYVISGGTWSISELFGGGVTGDIKASGYVNLGAAGLTNIRPYVEGPVGGAVPEAATWAMMIAGFALAGAAMRQRKLAVAFA